MSLKNRGRGRTRSVIFKVLSWAFGIPLALIAIAALACVWLHATADLGEPEFVPSQVPVVQVNDSLRRWGSSSLRIDPDGLYEMRVCGGPFERGEAIGKLGEDLLYQQEKAFADKLFEMVPSSRYRAFLHYFITIFNRRMGASVPLEYRQEIKAMSASCTHEFDEFGSPYERQMQYHSAHDIGHVMQDYMLVGCTSFAVWGRESADSSLLMARNFDFYMGEEFAKNKLVLFEKPDSGYAYVSVTWPGMLGVVSGMNTQGLAVTINASKLEVPSSSATPISILVKSILQYASNIEEAETIAASFKTFVCESILVGLSSQFVRESLPHRRRRAPLMGVAPGLDGWLIFLLGIAPLRLVRLRSQFVGESFLHQRRMSPLMGVAPGLDGWLIFLLRIAPLRLVGHPLLLVLSVQIIISQTVFVTIL